MLAVSVPFESRSIMKTFVTCFTLVCTVIAMFALVLLQLFFQVSSKITGIALKYLTVCCDMGQNDTIGKIELNPSFVLSSDNTNYKNDIQ